MTRSSIIHTMSNKSRLSTEMVFNLLNDYAKEHKKELKDDLFKAILQNGSLLDQAFSISSEYFMRKFHVVKLTNKLGGVIKYY